MGIKMFAVVSIALSFLTMGSKTTYGEDSARVVVIYGKNAPFTEAHAAEEFIRYADLLTGKKPILMKDNDILPKAEKNIVLVGGHATNILTKSLMDKGLVNFSGILPDSDGFIIKVTNDNQRKYLVLGGNNGLGTLYSVYHYFEEYCDVGYFHDGDHIPKNGKLNFSDNASSLENPRFNLRLMQRFGGGHWMLPKFTFRYWDWDEYKRHIDWWAKRKMNMNSLCLTVNPDTPVESIVEEVFDVGRPPAEPVYWGEWPITWDWPPEYREELEKKGIEYSRKLGFKIEYYMEFGAVPDRFKKSHPEIKYVEHIVPSIDPSDPRGKEYSKKVLSKVIKRLGTDHMYSSGVYGEHAPGADPLTLKTDTSLQMIEVLQEIDPHPDLRWRFDSWDFMLNPGGMWTKENVKTFLNALPDNLYIADTCTDIEFWNLPEPMHRKHGYFYGKRWAVGVINSLAGDEHLHGDFEAILRTAKDVTVNPKAQNCDGFRLVPENSDTNSMYWQFVTELAWNPADVTVDDFLKKYVVRRYGKISMENMFRSCRSLVDAMREMYSGPPISAGRPLYKVMAYVFENIQTEVTQKSFPERIVKTAKAIPFFRESLRLALLEKENQKDNKLYENDVVDIARGYLSQIFDFYLIDLTFASDRGDTEEFEKAVRKAGDCLDWIEKILSTREDFSLEKSIERVMRIEGTNPLTPQLIKERSFCSGAYCCVDNFEQMHHFYKPQFNAYIAKLKGKQTQTCKEIEKEWLRNSIHVSDAYRFKGTTMEAVSGAFAAFPDADLEEIKQKGKDIVAKDAFIEKDLVEGSRKIER